MLDKVFFAVIAVRLSSLFFIHQPHRVFIFPTALALVLSAPAITNNTNWTYIFGYLSGLPACFCLIPKIPGNELQIISYIVS